jgi:uncharacterized phage protein gp47/JayE
MTGLTDQGFVAKRLPQIKGEIEARLLESLGDLNLAPETVIGQKVGIDSDAQAGLWELLDLVYQSQYPSSASGVNLDRVVSLNGITRLAPLPTSVRAVVSGASGTVIPLGSLAKNSSTGEFYEALASKTIAAGSSVGAVVSINTVANSTNYTITLGVTDYTITSGVSATASSILTALASALPGSVTTMLASTSLALMYDTEQMVAVSANITIDQLSGYQDFANTIDGESLLPVGALDEIETPVAGWESVANRTAGVTGRDTETDEQLRIRRENSIRIAAKNTLEGIQAALEATDGVTQVLVRQNNGTVTDPDGVPPQHVWAIVQGGTAPDIARVLFDRVAGGIGTFGGELEQVTSAVTGQAYDINFDRPTIVPIYIEVEITGSAFLPADYVQLVRDALVEFGNSLNIGEDVIFTRLYCPIGNAIDSASYISSLLIDIVDPPLGTSNITIDNIELAQITEANISVLLA